MLSLLAFNLEVQGSSVAYITFKAQNTTRLLVLYLHRKPLGHHAPQSTYPTDLTDPSVRSRPSRPVQFDPDPIGSVAIRSRSRSRSLVACSVRSPRRRRPSQPVQFDPDPIRSVAIRSRSLVAGSVRSSSRRLDRPKPLQVVRLHPFIQLA